MKIRDICTLHTSSIRPKDDVMYHLYSLPAFDDNMQREELLGKDIHSNKFSLPDKCILFNKLNVRFKRVWRIQNCDSNKIASTEFLPLVVNESLVDYQYCYYLLISDRITNYLCGQNANTSGSHKRIDPNDFLDIEVTLPPLETQKRIGKILSDYDAKIKLSRDVCQTIDNVAHRLFEYWFIQFDFPNEQGKPYRNSGGEMIFNDKLKRDIPKGWKVSTLKELCIMYQPKTLGLKELEQGGKYLVYGANGTIGRYNSYNHSGSEIAMACRGSSCGTINRTMPHSWITGNAMVMKMKDEEIHNEYLRYALSLVNVAGAITGSGQPQLTRENLEKLTLLEPDRDLVLRYSKIVAPLVDLQIQQRSERALLISQRDEILPLLMNGQVCFLD